MDTKKTQLQEGIVDVGVEGGPDVQMTSGATVIDKNGRERTETVVETQEEERDEWEYGEDDKNLLDLISSFGPGEPAAWESSTAEEEEVVKRWNAHVNHGKSLMARGCRQSLL